MATNTETVNLNVNINADNGMKSVRDMRLEIKQLNIAMSEAGAAGDKVTYDKLKMTLGALKNDMRDLNMNMQASDPGELLSGFIKLGQGAVGAFAGITGAMALFGDESKTMQEIEKKAAVMIQTMMGLEQARALLIDKGNIAKMKGMLLSIQTQYKEITATWAQFTATQAQTAATKGATIQQWLWNAAMLANPIVAIIAGVAALTAGIYLLVKAQNAETDVEKNNRLAKEATNKAMSDGAKTTTETAIKLQSYLKIASDTTLKEKDRQTALNSMNTIMGTHLKLQDNLSSVTQKYIDSLVKQAQAQEIVKRLAEEMNKALELEINYKANPIYDEQAQADFKKWQDQITESKPTVDALKVALNDLTTATNESTTATNANATTIEYTKRINELRLGLLKDGIAKETAIINDKYDQEIKALDKNALKYDALVSAINDRRNADIRKNNSTRQKLQDESNYKLEHLNQLFTRQNEIDQARHDSDIIKQQEILKNALYEGSNENLLRIGELKKKEKEINERWDGYIGDAKIQSIKDITIKEKEASRAAFEEKTKNMDKENEPYLTLLKNQIDEEKKIWVNGLKDQQDAWKTLHENELQLREEIFGRSNNSLSTQLEHELQLNLDHNETLITEARRLAKFEHDLNDKENQRVREQAKIDYGEGTIQYENAVRERMDASSEYILATEENLQANILQINKSTVDKQYEIQDKYFKEILQLKVDAADTDLEAYEAKVELLDEQYAEDLQKYKDDADAKAAIDQKYEQDKRDLKIQFIEETAAKAREIQQLSSDFVGALLDAEYASIKEADANDVEGQKRVAKEKVEIQKKYAGIQFAITEAQIAINVAEAIAKAFAQTGILGFISAGLITAMGVAQTIVASKNYSKIMALKAEKGMLVGPSHAQGGIMVNAEGGEAIINAKSMSNPVLRQLASNINVAGGGVPFTNNRTKDSMFQATIDENVIRRIVSEVVSIPVINVESDITALQRKVKNIESKTILG